MADCIKKSGDWRGARASAKEMPRNTRLAESRIVNRFLDRMKSSLVDHIVDDDLGWIKLADYTIRKKGHAAKLIHSGLLISSITTWTKNKVGYVGIRPNVKEKNGTAVSEVARRQEEGYGNIPERPLWKPTAEEVYAEMKAGHDNVAQILDNIIRNGR